MPVNPPTSNLKSTRAIIIFAKQPLKGEVKTRLSSAISAENATELYSCMLQDTLDFSLGLYGITPFVFFLKSPDATEYFKEFAPQIESFEQSGDNLGERMLIAFKAVFAKGFSEVAIIGSDSPDLPEEYIYEAFNLLEYEHTDVVFGPAIDGGYYLLAMKQIWEELFFDMPWSSNTLLEVSLEKTRSRCIGASLLPKWYDIDRAEDIDRLLLNEDTRRAPKTMEIIGRLNSSPI